MATRGFLVASGRESKFQFLGQFIYVFRSRGICHAYLDLMEPPKVLKIFHLERMCCRLGDGVVGKLQKGKMRREAMI